MALLALGMVAVSMAWAAPAQANSKYAALVLDKDTGRVLFARNADAARFPASLTKIMTLYLVFGELERGTISLDTEWAVSANAAAQAPSKLGLAAGQTIKVEEAILALVTKSANDAAMVVAEGMAGSNEAFAQRMTATARDIGMRHTTFHNPHGLPDRRQVTTARDMSVLALRMMDDYPQYYGYFNTKSFKFRGRTYKNHNNLLSRYAGTNGIKTGYTRASGFNLTASVLRDGHHLVGVVMGGRTARSRDTHMIKILDDGFALLSGRGDLLIATAPIPRAKPDPSHGAPGHGAVAANQPASTPAAAPGGPTATTKLSDRRRLAAFVATAQAQTAPRTAAAPRPAARPNESTQASAQDSSPASTDVAGWLDSPATADTPQPMQGSGNATAVAATATAPSRAQAGNPDAAWRIQIGAYSDAEEAGRRIQAAVDRAPDVLKDKGPATVPVRTASRTLYRSRFTGFDGQDQANTACATLIEAGISCIIVPPDPLFAQSAN